MPELFIENNGLQSPDVLEGMKLTWERRGTPGRLDFTVLKDDALSFTEGDPVRLDADGGTLFFGFVFTKKRNKDGTIQVTALDQLRYFKNKDTLVDEGLTASALLRRLAEDFRLNLGAVADTGYVLDAVVEENQTLFDMVQGALDETLLHTGRLYVLYDDAGRLTLRDIREMRLDTLIDDAAAEDYSYESSIDAQTYNKVKLAFDNEKTGRRELFIAQDGAKMNDWGVLQYFETLRTGTGAAAKAEALLKLYNHRTRRLTVKNVFGDTRVRAGCALPVSLTLGDVVVANYMVVEKVVHTFGDGTHFMDLELIGGEFIA